LTKITDTSKVIVVAAWLFFNSKKLMRQQQRFGVNGAMLV
jgi:hypothetical protein